MSWTKGFEPPFISVRNAVIFNYLTLSANFALRAVPWEIKRFALLNFLSSSNILLNGTDSDLKTSESLIFSPFLPFFQMAKRCEFMIPYKTSAMNDALSTWYTVNLILKQWKKKRKNRRTNVIKQWIEMNKEKYLSCHSCFYSVHVVAINHIDCLIISMVFTCKNAFMRIYVVKPHQ